MQFLLLSKPARPSPHMVCTPPDDLRHITTMAYELDTRPVEACSTMIHIWMGFTNLSIDLISGS